MNSYSIKASTLSRHSGLLRSIGWLMVMGVTTLSLIQLPPTPNAIAGSDKLLHLTTYFLLSYWFFHTYYRHKPIIISGFLLLGWLLEILQSLTPYRFLEWLDMLMNATGVLLAYVIFWCLKIRLKWLLNR